ncbi:MAG: glycine dehydrogenase (aminomethyl-transferring) [Flavobacteriales bacterium]|nr:glycine dehydrogenase (aminomethyl-transferring) [Flavobacteriales bacterium]|tara:strand:- start:53095 stop:55980 length:2886 start_codon:yes stop_codon:yes gene_type:complete
MLIDKFSDRHIGPRKDDIIDMLKAVGSCSLTQLISETLPHNIHLTTKMNLPDALSESRYIEHIKRIARKNKNYRSYIGMGYFNTILPGVIQRNILENPGWYTAYTPYQAEIAQGRLEALLNFQTMVIDLTGMELANASLLDEGTAAAEAMAMLFGCRTRKQKKADVYKFFVSELCYPQTIAIIRTRAIPLGIELVVGNHNELELDDTYFGCILQYPSKYGEVYDYSSVIKMAKENEIGIVVAADLLSLSLLTPPGEWGADIVVGTTQRFGIPMGYGGPHAAYFAAAERYKRSIPGRIIGVSEDMDGNRALRMALQTREQHIKREKATSNICTAQVLLAVMASFYAVYHGRNGLKRISKNIHSLAATLSEGLTQLGYHQLNKIYFDTLKVGVGNVSMENIKTYAEDSKLNFNYIDDQTLSISIDEKDDLDNINNILEVFAKSCNHSDSVDLINEVLSGDYTEATARIPDHLYRKSTFMSHDVFNKYHSETELMRYIKSLENKDLSLTHSMIPLGSCTMKLNAASELFPLSWSEFGNLHPFAPAHQARGYHIMFHELEEMLCEITGFDAISLQPNSGAQGEFTGLMVIRAYHASRGNEHRDICLIPESAHGTNPASAVMAGMKVIIVPCNEDGNIDLKALRVKVDENAERLSCLMITYPSTHGVYEEDIIEITKIIHNKGGQVYMDGANMNAQVGITNPAIIGADVCHLNLHKTFAIPHGGGGPGAGPIGVLEHLKPFLPNNPLVKVGGENGMSISSAPWGSALIYSISYACIKMLGEKGLTLSTQIAILNANYLKEVLSEYYTILYKGVNGRVAHEMILDFRQFKKDGIEVVDIAKRLMDYGFHAPTVSFPVAGTLMIEPTESESKLELDRFCDAMIAIKSEIDEIVNGDIEVEDSVLKNAPHTIDLAVNDTWNFSYSRKKAFFPLNWINKHKFWPSVRRVNDAYGDRNLVCSCAPISDYKD